MNASLDQWISAIVAITVATSMIIYFGRISKKQDEEFFKDFWSNNQT
jgi:hypothetical protein